MDHECYIVSSGPESGRGKLKHRDALPDQNMRKIHHTVGEREYSVTTDAIKSFVILIFARAIFCNPHFCEGNFLKSLFL